MITEALLYVVFLHSWSSFVSVVLLFLAFLCILEISELGCQAHHNSRVSCLMRGKGGKCGKQWLKHREGGCSDWVVKYGDFSDSWLCGVPSGEDLGTGRFLLVTTAVACSSYL